MNEILCRSLWVNRLYACGQGKLRWVTKGHASLRPKDEGSTWEVTFESFHDRWAAYGPSESPEEGTSWGGWGSVCKDADESAWFISEPVLVTALTVTCNL